MTKVIRTFFYGNIYLGLSAVALCIETNLLITISLNRLPFYFLIFLCTCIYYTMIYVRSAGAKNYNERTLWYRHNFATINKTLLVTLALALGVFVFVAARNLPALYFLSPLQLLLIVAIPVAAGWYTFSLPFFGIKKIRQTGWLKPFIIGLTWAGWVTVYPLLIRQVQTGEMGDAFILPSILLCLQNFLFFSIIAIIFDLKDYQNDFRVKLKTLPVIFGIKNTFRRIIYPALFINLVTLFIFQWQQNFTLLQVGIQLIPYLLLLYIIANYRQQRSVLYYLVAVDGLVFVKAICGITSVLFLKK